MELHTTGLAVGVVVIKIHLLQLVMVETVVAVEVQFTIQIVHPVQAVLVLTLEDQVLHMWQVEVL